uniref:KHDRBS Qua1 domain-containing protein n=1 Tax=Meleagris gallopavo TaxID=9103 RepID=A0A803YNV2_MELGA
MLNKLLHVLHTAVISENGKCHVTDCFLFLLFSEIEKFQGSEGKKEDEEKKYLDVISNKNIKLSERVLIPVKQYPKVLEITHQL